MAQPILMLDEATTTATSGTLFGVWDTHRSTIQRAFQIWGTTTAGAGAATVLVETRHGFDAPWETSGTMTLVLGTTVTSDTVLTEAAWHETRARVTTLTGTGAAVSCSVGY